jgi:hypothetical protein
MKRSAALIFLDGHTLAVTIRLRRVLPPRVRTGADSPRELHLRTLRDSLVTALAR